MRNRFPKDIAALLIGSGRAPIKTHVEMGALDFLMASALKIVFPNQRVGAVSEILNARKGSDLTHSPLHLHSSPRQVLSRGPGALNLRC